MSDKPWTVLGIPIDCSGRATGVERMPAALRAAGLVARVGARDLGDLPVAIDDSTRDSVTGIIGFDAVCDRVCLVRWQTSRLDDLIADDDQLAILGLGCPSQVRECLVSVAAEPLHQDHK